MQKFTSFWIGVISSLIVLMLAATAQANPTQVDTYANEPQIAALSPTSSVVVSLKADGGPLAVYATVDGGTTDLVSTSPSHPQLAPRIAALDTPNQYVAVYLSQDPYERHNRFRIMDASGATVMAADARVAPAGGEDQWYAEVAALPGGRFVIVWHETNPDSIRARVFDSSGNGGPIVDVLVTTGSLGLSRIHPAIAATSDGFAIVFAEPGSDGGVRFSGRHYEISASATDIMPTNPSSYFQVGMYDPPPVLRHVPELQSWQDGVALAFYRGGGPTYEVAVEFHHLAGLIATDPPSFSYVAGTTDEDCLIAPALALNGDRALVTWTTIGTWKQPSHGCPSTTPSSQSEQAFSAWYREIQIEGPNAGPIGSTPVQLARPTAQGTLSTYGQQMHSSVTALGCGFAIAWRAGANQFTPIQTATGDIFTLTTDCPPTPVCEAPPSDMTFWARFDRDLREQDAISGSRFANPAPFTTLEPADLMGHTGHFARLTTGNEGLRMPRNRWQVTDPSPVGFRENDFSIDMWVRIPNPGRRPGAVWFFDTRAPGGDETTANGISLFSVAEALYFKMSRNGILISANSQPVLQRDTWHHIAVTVDRDDVDGGTIYVDGRPVLVRHYVQDFDPDTPEQPPVTNAMHFDPTALEGETLGNNNPMFINVDRFDNQLTFEFDPFDIDEIEVFSRVLTPTELETLATAPKCR